ncbi:hypothetical protein [Herbidospora daliensis]|uniref:hypothetical protein n=1 Tax=Herbidospora daliensis TaxID=295585 RepID=UPI00078505A0|nr:hypothetical protein [Herbidospora daliensis]
MPHSEFLKWSQDDRDKAIWQMVRSRQRCSGCGTRADEWDPDKGGRTDAYYAEITQCRGCAQIGALSKGLTDESYGARVALIPHDDDTTREVTGGERPQRPNRRRPPRPRARRRKG